MSFWMFDLSTMVIHFMPQHIHQLVSSRHCFISSPKEGPTLGLCAEWFILTCLESIFCGNVQCIAFDSVKHFTSSWRLPSVEWTCAAGRANLNIISASHEHKFQFVVNKFCVHILQKSTTSSQTTAREIRLSPISRAS